MASAIRVRFAGVWGHSIMGTPRPRSAVMLRAIWYGSANTWARRNRRCCAADPLFHLAEVEGLLGRVPPDAMEGDDEVLGVADHAHGGAGVVLGRRIEPHEDRDLRGEPSGPHVGSTQASHSSAVRNWDSAET